MFRTWQRPPLRSAHPAGQHGVGGDPAEQRGPEPGCIARRVKEMTQPCLLDRLVIISLVAAWAARAPEPDEERQRHHGPGPAQVEGQLRAADGRTQSTLADPQADCRRRRGGCRRWVARLCARLCAWLCARPLTCSTAASSWRRPRPSRRSSGR